MEGICTLDSTINRCPNHKKGNCIPSNEQCMFWLEKDAPVKDKYVREERWYEKYYK